MVAPPVREITRSLPLGVHAVGVARQFVATTVPDWGGGTEDVAAVALLSSELVTNAVLYGYGADELTLRHDDGRLRISVADRSLTLPTPREPSDDAEIGRGMQLIEAFADSWGVDPGADGKTVWCEVVLSGR